MQLNTLSKEQGKALKVVLNQVSRLIEQLIETGMSTASRHTAEQFGQAFKQLSSMRLIRLGSNVRFINQEVERYLSQDESFSPRRLTFFINRSWLMCQGLLDAIDRSDEALWKTLSFNSATETLDQLNVVALGVSKKLVPGVFAAFEFRLRTVDPNHDLASKSLVFSLVFPLRPEQTIHPEAFMEFDQKQKYRPKIFLTHAIQLSSVALSYETENRVRVSLQPDSKVEGLYPIEKLSDLEQLAQWDSELGGQQLANYQPTPFDLEIDLQTEILLKDWTMGDIRHDAGFPDKYVIDMSAAGVDYIALVSTSEEGSALLHALKELAKLLSRPPLFALMHYELAKRVLQPLSILKNNKPEHLMLGQDKTDYQTLLKQLQ